MPHLFESLIGLEAAPDEDVESIHKTTSCRLSLPCRYMVPFL